MNKSFQRSVRLSVSAIALVAVVSWASRASAQVDVTAPGNPIVGVQATAQQAGPSSIAQPSPPAPGTEPNRFPSPNETPAKAIDNLFAGPVPPAPATGTKYLNFARLNTGVIVTPGPSLVTGLRVYTANDSPERDPLTYTLEGTNSATPNTASGTDFTPISSGNLGIDTIPAGAAGRFFAGPILGPFTNTTVYSSYRLLFPTVRGTPTDPNGGNSMQVGEIELLGTVIPEPATSVLLGGAALGLLVVRARRHRVA